MTLQQHFVLIGSSKPYKTINTSSFIIIIGSLWICFSVLYVRFLYTSCLMIDHRFSMGFKSEEHGGRTLANCYP